MEIEFGADVIDRNDTVIGKVDYLVRDTWSGELRKFMVRREKEDLFFSPDEVIEADSSRIKVDFTVDVQDGAR